MFLVKKYVRKRRNIFKEMNGIKKGDRTIAVSSIDL